MDIDWAPVSSETGPAVTQYTDMLQSAGARASCWSDWGGTCSDHKYKGQLYTTWQVHIHVCVYSSLMLFVRLLKNSHQDVDRRYSSDLKCESAKHQGDGSTLRLPCSAWAPPFVNDSTTVKSMFNSKNRPLRWKIIERTRFSRQTKKKKNITWLSYVFWIFTHLIYTQLYERKPLKIKVLSWSHRLQLGVCAAVMRRLQTACRNHCLQLVPFTQDACQFSICCLIQHTVVYVCVVLVHFVPVCFKSQKIWVKSLLWGPFPLFNKA